MSTSHFLALVKIIKSRASPLSNFFVSMIDVSRLTAACYTTAKASHYFNKVKMLALLNFVQKFFCICKSRNSRNFKVVASYADLRFGITACQQRTKLRVNNPRGQRQRYGTFR